MHCLFLFCAGEDAGCRLEMPKGVLGAELCAQGLDNQREIAHYTEIMPCRDPLHQKRNCKAYYQAHKEEIRKRQNSYSKDYYAKNKKTLLVRKNSREKARRKADPNFKLNCYLRNRVRNVLVGFRKSARTLLLLGCSIEFLREHLEKQFRPGMAWENYGPVWHVDHILPCAKFHLQHSEEQEICFHWTNLQPLFATDNLSKSDKII